MSKPVIPEPAPLLDLHDGESPIEWENLPFADSDMKKLIRRRGSDWSRRADRWHKYLERCRLWVRLGPTMPIALGAVATLCVGLKLPRPELYPLLATTIGALVAWRAAIAKAALEATKASECWVTADRLAEWYRGAVARFGLVEDYLLLAESQKIESKARFDLPPSIAEVLEKVS